MPAAVVAAGVVALSAASATAARPEALYVSPQGTNNAKCTHSEPCKTVSHAVAVAKPGETIMVARGVYKEEVKVAKELTVIGVGEPTINASGRANGFLITGNGAAGATVRGFMVEHASFEGILAMKTSRVTIAGNTVRDNDLGSRASTLTGECAPQGQVPGDCGEGLHLMTVTRSLVTSNLVTGNLGGILLTDELGPTARNTVSHNRVVKNLYDCGITVAGHSTKAVSTTTGKPQPRLGGVYDNKIENNVSNGNGTKGEGAGVLLAAAAPGAGVYDNIVRGNTANGNELAGVTIHSHTPFQDVDGNVIVNNKLRHDGTGSGDTEYGEKGTVGILAGSDVTKLTGIVITGNTISNSHYGIYTKNDARTVKPGANTFHNVAIPVKQI